MSMPRAPPTLGAGGAKETGGGAPWQAASNKPAGSSTDS
jgi:hypothetical protein